MMLLNVLASYEAFKGNQDQALNYFKSSYLLSYKYMRHNSTYNKSFIVYFQRNLFSTMMYLEKFGFFSRVQSDFLPFLQDLHIDFEQMDQEAVKRDYRLIKALFTFSDEDIQ